MQWKLGMREGRWCTLVLMRVIQVVWAVKNRSEPKEIHIIRTQELIETRGGRILGLSHQNRVPLRADCCWKLEPHACLAINSNHHSLSATCLVQRSTVKGPSPS
ncbi:Uncharacterized protein TCM_033929 [Theobroma cacao]|uniref:Secreted protein n=1 Tax=Theobroma cacao TaxID=3641 RepID=A0A061FJE6_THECC|nr:Uncharacterized protein TCM_033929 [Theobroma cacao]